MIRSVQGRSWLEPWMAGWQSMRLADALRTLRIGCTVVAQSEPENWHKLVDDPRRFTVVDLELHSGLELGRDAYNSKCLATVRKTGRTHLGRRAGFNDLWVPVLSRRQVNAVLACGPFLTASPTLESLREAWRVLSRSDAETEDEGFVRYVRCALGTHVYEGPALDALTAFVQRLAAVMAGAGPARLVDEHLAPWRDVLRLVPEARMWEIADDLVDRDRHVLWTAGLRTKDLVREGTTRMPNHVVTIAPSERRGEGLGAAALMLRMNRLQRACAAFAAQTGDVIAGCVGDEAALLLTHVDAPRPERARSRLVSFAERVMRFTRRTLDMDVVCGISSAARTGAELPARHDEALWAVLWGLHKGQSVTLYSEEAGVHDASSPALLYRSSRALCESFALGHPQETSVAAQQMVKDVFWISGGSVEVMRSHFLGVLWELLAIAERRYAIDKRTASDLLASITARLRETRTPRQVTEAFTSTVRELVAAAERPSALGLRAKLERACRLAEQAEPGQSVDPASIAARVGLSRAQFSRCFRDAYGVGFRRYVLSARVRRSQRLLRETSLRIGRVGTESGFSSPSYFVQAFKRETGMTPQQYKEKIRRR
jgi:AraC-like DNA-binding protein